jgi:hypothetical protein
MHFDDSTACRWPYISGDRFLRNREHMCFVSSLGEDGCALLLFAAALLSSSGDLDLDGSSADNDDSKPLLGLSQPPLSANGNTRVLIYRFGLLPFVYYCCVVAPMSIE